ncbi:hypothetical protein HS088_TW02G00465 [Tripterygium wilfordii]|uniref:Pentatricopeptide repeat-containing protein n=1 Tax=Tripterygium wilfordii TaxID=458696 RepID=A0A7J7DYW2_TRIWF|nr:hypothetical protein HS088_TW02G00465 [Tripterygium wilfordii]
MEKAGVAADVNTFGVLIHGLCAIGKQLEPNGVIYNTYCKEDSSYKTLRLLKEMNARGMVPIVARYIVRQLEFCSRMGSGKRLFSLQPSVSIYNIISGAKHDVQSRM